MFKIWPYFSPKILVYTLGMLTQMRNRKQISPLPYPCWAFLQYSPKEKKRTLENQNDCWKKLIQADIDLVSISFMDFRKKSCNVHCFMHNKLTVKGAYICFRYSCIWELNNTLIQDICRSGLSGSILFVYYYSVFNLKSIVHKM